MKDIKEIAESIQAIEVLNETPEKVISVKAIDDELFDKNSIGWCSDKNIELIKELKCGTVIIGIVLRNQLIIKDYPSVCFLVVENPRSAFAAMLKAHFIKIESTGVNGVNCQIHASVQVDLSKVRFGNNVVIEENCIIGNHVFIDHNSVLKAETVVHDNVKIGANCTIGGVGFGYEANEIGEYEVIPHIGNVEIDSFVEIGNNVCIDRAVLGSTRIHEHVKIDNLVHIAHGVEIGKNSLIIANAMIAGSVKIGENCWIAPSSSIRQKLHIGNSALVGLGSVVIKDVAENAIVAGVPAKKMN